MRGRATATSSGCGCGAGAAAAGSRAAGVRELVVGVRGGPLRELRLLRRALGPSVRVRGLVRGLRGVPGRRLGLPVRGVEFAFFSLEFRPERFGGFVRRRELRLQPADPPALLFDLLVQLRVRRRRRRRRHPAAAAPAAPAPPSRARPTDATEASRASSFAPRAPPRTRRAFARGGARSRSSAFVRRSRSASCAVVSSFAAFRSRSRIFASRSTSALRRSTSSAASAPLARCFFLYASTSRLSASMTPASSSTAFLCSARRRAASSACASIADWRSRLSPVDLVREVLRGRGVPALRLVRLPSRAFDGARRPRVL